MYEQTKLGKMICFHNRYDLGDNHAFDHQNYSGWVELKRAIAKFYNAGVILPLYMMDHSGLTISTHPFYDEWDSGQLGFIVASKKDITEYFMTTYCTKQCKKVTIEILMEEVSNYNDELNDEHEESIEEFNEEGYDDGC